MRPETIQKIFGITELILTVAVVLYIVLTVFEVNNTDFLKIEERNLRLHLGLLIFAFFAPRFGGVLAGGMESMLWGVHFSEQFFQHLLIAFILPLFFIGTFTSMAFFILLNRYAQKALEIKELR